MKKKDFKITILTVDKAEQRYLNLKNTGMAYLTKKALDNNYCIAVFEYNDLSKETYSDWTNNAKIAIAHELQTNIANIDFFGFTDLSESMHNKLYLAFKKRVNPRFPNSPGISFI